MGWLANWIFALFFDFIKRKLVIKMSEIKSIDVARAALSVSLTRDKGEETSTKMSFRRSGIMTASFSITGDFMSSIQKWIEQTLAIAKNEGIICGSFVDSGSIVGAAREALAQVMPKAFGVNVGGKIGIAYCNENLAVAVYLGIGLLNLHDVAVGLGHRAVQRITDHS